MNERAKKKPREFGVVEGREGVSERKKEEAQNLNLYIRVIRFAY